MKEPPLLLFPAPIGPLHELRGAWSLWPGLLFTWSITVSQSSNSRYRKGVSRISKDLPRNALCRGAVLVQTHRARKRPSL